MRVVVYIKACYFKAILSAYHHHEQGSMSCQN